MLPFMRFEANIDVLGNYIPDQELSVFPESSL